MLPIARSTAAACFGTDARVVTRLQPVQALLILAHRTPVSTGISLATCLSGDYATSLVTAVSETKAWHHFHP